MPYFWDSAHWVLYTALWFGLHVISVVFCGLIALALTFMSAGYLTNRLPLPIAAISDKAPTNRARRVAESEYHEKLFFILLPISLLTFTLGTLAPFLLLGYVPDFPFVSLMYPWIGASTPGGLCAIGMIVIETWISARKLIWGPSLHDQAVELEGKYPWHCVFDPDCPEMERAYEEGALEGALTRAEESRIWANLFRYRWVDVQRAEERFQRALDEKVAYYETRDALPEKAEKGIV